MKESIKAKELAVQEVLKLYKRNPTKKDIVLEALGKIGGIKAIEAIMMISKKYPSKKELVIKSLGEAGKNS